MGLRTLADTAFVFCNGHNKWGFLEEAPRILTSGGLWVTVFFLNSLQ